MPKAKCVPQGVFEQYAVSARGPWLPTTHAFLLKPKTYKSVKPICELSFLTLIFLHVPTHYDGNVIGAPAVQRVL